MRYLGLLLAVIGVVALVLGLLATIGAARIVPFDYEATNHVGQVIAGLVLIPLGLYLNSLFKKQER